jgi:predicted transcriptional regulator
MDSDSETLIYRFILELSVNNQYNSAMTERFAEVDRMQLRRLRQEQALSLRDLAQRSGVAYDTINRLELGKQDAQPRTIRRLAEALDVQPKELMKREE